LLDSTSNSDSRKPADANWRWWGITLIVTSVLVICVESHWRSQGHRPSVVDDKDLWCAKRTDITSDPQCLVLLGASRIQLGFDTELFADHYPQWTLSHLAVDGASPLATLKALSEDETFKGVIICAVAMPMVRDDHLQDQQPWLDHYRDHWTINRSINRRMSSFAQSKLTLMNPLFSFNNMLEHAVDGEWPTPHYVTTLTDRSRAADFSKTDVQTHITHRNESAQKQLANKPIDFHEQWHAIGKNIHAWVAAIKLRGGTVVFLRMPIDGGYAAAYNKYAPREEYFDHFAKITGAQTIHFQDIPEMAKLHCPEGSHIDQRDKETLTNALLNELVNRKLLPSAKRKSIQQ
jgi:hypothetical protein